MPMCFRLCGLASETWGPSYSDLNRIKCSKSHAASLLQNSMSPAQPWLCTSLGLGKIGSEVHARYHSWYGHDRYLMAIDTSCTYSVWEHKSPDGAGLEQPIWHGACVPRGTSKPMVCGMWVLRTGHWREGVKGTYCYLPTTWLLRQRWKFNNTFDWTNDWFDINMFLFYVIQTFKNYLLIMFLYIYN